MERNKIVGTSIEKVRRAVADTHALGNVRKWSQAGDPFALYVIITLRCTKLLCNKGLRTSNLAASHWQDRLFLHTFYSALELATNKGTALD